MVEIQAGADRQRVGGRQIWGRSTGKAETGFRTLSSEGFQRGNNVIGFVLLKECSSQRTLGVSEGLCATQL